MTARARDPRGGRGDRASDRTPVDRRAMDAEHGSGAADEEDAELRGVNPIGGRRAARWGFDDNAHRLSVQSSRKAPGGIAALRADFDPKRTPQPTPRMTGPGRPRAGRFGHLKGPSGQSILERVVGESPLEYGISRFRCLRASAVAAFVVLPRGRMVVSRKKHDQSRCGRSPRASDATARFFCRIHEITRHPIRLATPARTGDPFHANIRRSA